MTDWLDRSEYPFESHYLDVPDGRMHYVDEGRGEVILMLHGTPTWSFLYRHLIKGLRDDYRVIAPDHLGSGLSERPSNYSYRPADHARNLTALIQALDLKDMTLMVHDFGGSIGLSYALEHPQNVRRLVLFNTWMWSLRNERDKAIIGRIIGSPLGRFLYERLNFEFNVIMPGVYGDRSKLTPTIRTHYKAPLDEYIAWIYGRELLGSSDWFESLWDKRDALRDIPMLLLWGLKDPAFGKPYLEQWQTDFSHAETHTFPNAGHFVQEEVGADLLPIITQFLNA